MLCDDLVEDFFVEVNIWEEEGVQVCGALARFELTSNRLALLGKSVVIVFVLIHD